MKDMKFPVLLDTYGSILSERKFELLDYYYNNDYSLSEIAELTGISRQGIRDSINKSKEEILNLESKLKISENKENILRLISSIEQSFINNEFDKDELLKKIQEIKSILLL